MKQIEEEIERVYKLYGISSEQKVVTSFRTKPYDTKLQSRFKQTHSAEEKEPHAIFGNSTSPLHHI